MAGLGGGGQGTGLEVAGLRAFLRSLGDLLPRALEPVAVGGLGVVADQDRLVGGVPEQPGSGLVGKLGAAGGVVPVASEPLGSGCGLVGAVGLALGERRG